MASSIVDNHGDESKPSQVDDGSVSTPSVSSFLGWSQGFTEEN